MPTLVADAVVIGGGHHGLVAAAVLADAGRDVCVVESADVVGGAVRSAQLHPDFTTDLFSAFYPLAAASPVLRAALHRRAATAGADVRTGEHVERIDVRAGRAVAVHTAGGLTVRARRAVVADVAAPALYRDLLDPGVLPSRLLADLQRFCGTPRS